MAVDPSTDGGVSGLLGPGFDPAALYTGDLSSPATKAQFAQRGLLAMAGSFADSAMPTRVPTPFGAVLGHAAAALGTSEDAVMDARLKAAQAGLYGAQGQAATALVGARKAFTSAVGNLGNLMKPDAADTGVPPADAAASAPVDPSVAAIDATTPKTSSAAPGTTPAAAGPQALKIDPLPTNTPTVAYDPKVSHGDYLHQLVGTASTVPGVLPAGYTAEVFSQNRPGATVAGTGGVSQHASDNAVDVKIYDADHKLVPNDVGVPDSSKLYGRLALSMRQMIDPSLSPQFAWGGNFGEQDIMHYDLGGDRGQRGTMATMADAAKHVVQVAQTTNGGAAAGPPAGAEPLPPAPTNSAAGLLSPQGAAPPAGGPLPPGPGPAGPAPGPAAAATAAAPPGLLARLGIIPSANAAELPPTAAAPPAGGPGPMVPGNAIAAAAGQNAPRPLPAPNVPSLVPPPPNAAPVPPVAGGPAPAPAAAAPVPAPAPAPAARPAAGPPTPLSAPAVLSPAKIAGLTQLMALGKVAGIDLSDVITNSPAWKATVAAATKDVENRSDLQYQPLIKGRVAAAEFPYKAAEAILPQQTRGEQARETYADQMVDVPGLGWVQRKNIPGYTQGSAAPAPAPTAAAPTPGAPASAAPAPGAPTPLFPAQTPAQKAIFEQNLAQASEQLKTYQADKQTMPMQISNADAISDLMKRTQLGWGADTRQQAAMILQGLGVPQEAIKQFSGIDTSAGGTLNKLFLQFSADAVRAMGAREPGSVISLFSQAYPNLETDPNAARLMTNALRMQAQWKFDRANAAEQYNAQQQQNAGPFGQNYKGLTGFDQQFSQTNNPRDYWRAAAAMSGDTGLAWSGTSDADKKVIYDHIPAGRQFRAADGKLYTKPGGQ